jgi:glycosyltransferase involved in cell wall biosynthesis
MPKTVAFLWSNVSGYMARCWKTLARRGDYAVYVIARNTEVQSEYSPGVMTGVQWERTEGTLGRRTEQVRALFRRLKPDIVVVGGWSDRAYLAGLLYHRANVVRILAMDNVTREGRRQWLAKPVLHWITSHFDFVMVPGERAAQYAVAIGVPWGRIRTPLYGIDFDAFAIANRERVGWPSRFAFVGRYVEEKGTRVLLQAYRRYRRLVSDPWELITCGAGPLKGEVARAEGVNDVGFVQPHDLPRVLAQAGAFVLPSSHDNWGVAIAEAAAAGLPIIATRTCGAIVECVRDGWNGYVIPPDDVEALCDAFLAVHRSQDLRVMGERSLELARPFAADQWAAAWVRMFEEAFEHRRPKKQPWAEGYDSRFSPHQGSPHQG